MFWQAMLPNLETLSVHNMNGVRGIVDGHMPIGSLSNLRIIWISDCNGLVHVFASNSINLLQSLEKLEVSCARSLEVVFDFTCLNVEGKESLESPFACLESLDLHDLPKLKYIWTMLPEGLHGFKNLRSINLFKCPNLRYLVSSSMAKMLVCLEKLTIFDCEKMEAIIGVEEREITEIECDNYRVKERKKDREESTNRIVFPKLRHLSVRCLDDFRMLCSGNVELELPSLTELIINDCPNYIVRRSSATSLNNVIYDEETLTLNDFISWLKVLYKMPDLEELYIGGINGISCAVDEQIPIGSLSKLQIPLSSCDGLVHIASADSIKLLYSLRVLQLREVSCLEVVFDFTGLNIEGEEPLAHLESLNLSYLPKLKLLWRMLPEGIHAFKNLRLLGVWGCNNLRYLLSPSMAEMLVGLESLVLIKCEQMEAIIGVDESEITGTKFDEDGVKKEKKKDGEESTNKIVFPKLKRVKVREVGNFRMLCSLNVDLELFSLTELSIVDCPGMTKLCVGQLSAPRLSNVEVTYSITREGANKVTLDDFNSWLKLCESRIRCLNCSYLEKEVCDHLE